mgnify:CR=1 FL=1
MNKTKKSIFLTGATGVMGKAGLEELCRRLDRFNITLLVRPSKTNKRKMMPYAQKEGIHIVWGDLMNYDDVLRCVKGTDIVLHVGGMVSPQCDPYPKTTRKVNLTSAQHIVNAIKAQPNADDIALVYIGSIAQTGHRNVPYHWGRTGDPINPAVYLEMRGGTHHSRVGGQEMGVLATKRYIISRFDFKWFKSYYLSHTFACRGRMGYGRRLRTIVG